MPADELFPKTLYIMAETSIVIISSIGVICNSYLFTMFAAKLSSSNGFQKFCMLKSLCNLIICSAFLFWVAPIAGLRLSLVDISYVVNRVIGLTAGTAAFFLSSLLNVCTSCNRFFALQFPLGLKTAQGIPFTYLSILTSLILVGVFCIFTIPEGCGFLFDPDLFVWRPEFSECADKFAVVVPYIVIITTTVMNAFNVAIVVHLMMLKMNGVKKEDVDKRRKRWKVMFMQSLIQDCLQLMQIVCSYFLFKLNDALWFQFLCRTFSFILATTLDGSVMFVCHSEFHPAWFKSVHNGRRALSKFSSVSSRISIRVDHARKHSHAVTVA